MSPPKPAEELLRDAVVAAAPVDESSPITLANGEVVTLGTVIAMTNGEALAWISH